MGRSADNREARLAGLCARLGLAEREVMGLRYQLLHRTVAALEEAESWRAGVGVLRVEHFTSGGTAERDSFRDFCEFAELLNAVIAHGRLAEFSVPGALPLLAGWLDVECASDADVAAALG